MYVVLDVLYWIFAHALAGFAILLVVLTTMSFSGVAVRDLRSRWRRRHP